MTVETTDRKEEFAGGQGSLTFSFKVLPGHPEHVKVLTVTSGTETALTYLTDYTVALELDGVGGTVTVSPSFGTEYTYTVYRATTNKQESDYDDYNQFPADTIEEDFDRGILLDQEQAEDLGRALTLPVSSTISTLSLPNPVAGKALLWNDDANAIINSTDDFDDIVTDASNYATSASTSATLAGNYATTASTGASTASTQATLAGNYATTASTEATAAANSATTASTQATLAGNYATTASTSATTASTQATLAGNYATTASTQATLAGNYATTASTQATTASTQATLAGNYATTASTEATNAANSATSASTSATLAGNYATTASTAAATIPDPTGQTVADQIRVNAAQDAYELFTPSGGSGKHTLRSSRDISLTTSTVALSGFGFQPSYLIMFGSIVDEDTSSYGLISDSGTGGCVSSLGVALNDLFTPLDDILASFRIGVSDYNQVTVNSWDADGVTLTWTKTGSPTGTVFYYIIAFE